MNKSTNKKKSKKKGIEKRRIISSTGFTLIELLASIAVLSIIAMIVIYIGTNIVTSAKENSYTVTINNIEVQAGNYINENQSTMNWLPMSGVDREYQCVTVQNLIDSGYFKSDILDSYIDDDLLVNKNNYIYLERDKNTKTVTKKILITDTDYDDDYCGDVKSDGRIHIVSYPKGWSKSKNVTIYYDLVNNISGNVSDYSYSSSFDANNSSNSIPSSIGNFTKSSYKKEFTVYDNGTVNATIGGNDLNISNSYVINTVDVGEPSALIESANKVASIQDVTLNISDDAGVVAYYFGLEDPSKTSVDWIELDETKSKEIDTTVSSSGTYYLGVKDVVDNVVVVSKVFYQTTLSISNATVSPDKIITMSGDKFTIPSVTVNSYYTFDGWYTNSSYSGNAITEYTPTGDDTLYGKTIENTLNGGSVTISGDTGTGKTITANITAPVPNPSTSASISYTYQWYLNSTKSTSGGTAISGATSSTLKLDSTMADKYAYVVVNATLSNYRATSFSAVSNIIKNADFTGSVKIEGKNTYGETLTVNIDGIEPDADSYTYQWYYNTTNSTSGGTKISGATKQSVSLTGTTVGKYVYVEVTASKENYNDKTFTDVTDVTNNSTATVSKRPITIIANSNSKTYDGTALTDSGCSVSTTSGMGLGFNHSIKSCTMTSASTITNVGSVTNDLSSVAINNNEKTATVNSYYDISFVDGTLTVNKSPTATVGNCNSLTYNGSSQTLASGGNYVTYNNNTRTVVGNQTVDVNADDNHTFADGTTAKTLSCSIGKKNLTITAKAQTINYGSSITTGTGQITTSGLVSGHSVSAITLTPSRSDAGTGTITASAATVSNSSGTTVTNNYNITYKTGVLTINKIANTVTISAKSLTYTGSAQELVTASNAKGTVYYSTSTELTSSNYSSKRSTTISKGTNAGSYTVYYYATGNANYNAKKGSVSVTIGKKALTITAKAQTIIYGSSIATGTGQITASGLVSGHSVSAITLTPSRTSVGTGTITPSAATVKSGSTDVTSNYNITYKTGVLTINEKPIRVYYNVNGGTISGTYSSNSNGWVTNSDGSYYYETWKSTDNKDLSNYNNSNYINITRSAYKGVSGAEWNTKADASGTSFNQATNYSYSTLKSYASDKGTYYEIDLYVNWVESYKYQTFTVNGTWYIWSQPAYLHAGDNGDVRVYEGENRGLVTSYTLKSSIKKSYAMGTWMKTDPDTGEKVNVYIRTYNIDNLTYIYKDDIHWVQKLNTDDKEDLFPFIRVWIREKHITRYGSLGCLYWVANDGTETYYYLGEEFNNGKREKANCVGAQYVELDSEKYWSIWIPWSCKDPATCPSNYVSVEEFDTNSSMNVAIEDIPSSWTDVDS